MRRARQASHRHGLLQHGASREENAIVLQMLNSCVRPSEVTRRIAVEHVNVIVDVVNNRYQNLAGVPTRRRVQTLNLVFNNQSQLF